MSTRQLTAPAHRLPPPPPPEGRQRTVIVVLSLASIVALLLLAFTVGEGRETPREPAPSDASSGDMLDPVRPHNQVTLDPTAAGTEAAVRHGWPLIQQDEFDGVALDTTKWHTYSGQTTDEVGRHDPKNLSVADGVFAITSRGTSSGGMSWANGQMYGRWEVRVKTQVANGYSAVVLLWPDAEDFPVGGEIDFMEIPLGHRQESNFVLHYGEDNSQNGTSVAGDFSQWHNYAVEWTPDRIVGFIDGQEIFRTTDRSQFPPRPMHMAIQQDPGPFGNGWVPGPDASTPAEVKLQVDWVRIYGL